MGLRFTFTRSIGDRVLTTVGITGRITSLCVDHGGEVYAVEWINGRGDVRSRWFRISEIVGTAVTEQ